MLLSGNIVLIVVGIVYCYWIWNDWVIVVNCIYVIIVIVIIIKSIVILIVIITTYITIIITLKLMFHQYLRYQLLPRTNNTHLSRGIIPSIWWWFTIIITNTLITIIVVVVVFIIGIIFIIVRLTIKTLINIITPHMHLFSPWLNPLLYQTPIIIIINHHPLLTQQPLLLQPQPPLPLIQLLLPPT